MRAMLDAVLRRPQAVSIIALGLLVAMAWAWLLTGAGMGGMATGGMAMDGMTMPMSMSWSPGRYALTFAMWWIMMVAMMLPSAASAILLYARVAQHSDGVGRMAMGYFLGGYLAAWGLFSALATLLQHGLERAGYLAAGTMASQDRTFSAAVLIAVGLYQLSPLKDACLHRCQSSAQFLSRHWQAGAFGAVRLGLLHGAFCVGCCWMLMALLLVGGIMNLAWIAVLTAIVAAEKLLPWGRWVAVVSGLACLAWGVGLAMG